MSTTFDSIVSGLLAVRESSVPMGPYAQWIGLSFVVHSVLFLVLPASPWLPKLGDNPPNWKSTKPYDRRGDSIAIRNGLVSTIHAIVACCCVIGWVSNYHFDWFDFQRNMQGGIVSKSNSNGDAWFALGTSNTLGYFIYDLICMLVYNKYLGNTGAYIHHVCIGLALAVGIFLGQGRTYHFLFLIEEFSTPPLNFKNLYRNSPKAYKIWSILFAGSFYLCRGVVGLSASLTCYWCIWTYFQAHRNDALGNNPYWVAIIALNTIMFSISRGLNIYWMSLIAKKIMEKPKKIEAKKL